MSLVSPGITFLGLKIQLPQKGVDLITYSEMNCQPAQRPADQALSKAELSHLS